MTDPTALGAALLRLLPPEAAHRWALWALRRGLVPRPPARPDPPALTVSLWGLAFPNPIGLAAGFDKDAEVTDAVLGHGFGFVETGTVTPRPQSGNPKPRLFRLTEDKALINRLGFNNGGMDAAARRLAARDRSRGLVGINIGRNRDSEDAIADYVAGLACLAPHADYCVVNVSSPNTPGLRDLQAPEALDALISALQDARAGSKSPLLIKIAPDLDDKAAAGIAEVALARGIDGLIVSNTTTARPGLRSAHRGEQGGLSGRPLMAPSTRLLGLMYRLTRGALPLIGVGGVAGGADAYAKIRAGASLVQLYSALIYQGFGLVNRIKHDLAARLAADGFATVGDAVGVDAEDARAADRDAR